MHLASTSVETLNAPDPRNLLSGLGALGATILVVALIPAALELHRARARTR